MSALAGNFLLDEGGLIIDKFGGLSEVDGCTRLARSFVVGGKLGTLETEEAATPVLWYMLASEYLKGRS